MSPVAFLGGGVGLGLFVVGRAILARPRPLTLSLQRLERVGFSVAEQQSMVRSSGRHRTEERIVGVLRGHLGVRVEKDLVVMERSVERFVIEKIATALAMIGRPAQAAEFAAGLAALGQPAQAEQLAAVGATLATISTSLAGHLPARHARKVLCKNTWITDVRSCTY